MKKRTDKTEVLAWGALLLAFCIGCATIYWNSYVDEGDNLITGLLLSRGAVLYRDVFSHHFPFTYYWAAVVISIFGKSILAVRLSVWIFQIASFALAMKLSRFYLTLGVAGLCWSIVGPLYRSNVLLYNPFAAASLLVVFVLVLAIATGQIKPSWMHALVIGLFSAIAGLSDPLAVYAVGVALIFLVVTDWRRGLAAGATLGAGIAVYAAYLAASGTLADFWNRAVLFNSQIYNQYLPASPIRFREYLGQIVRGLEVLAPDWRETNPLREITTYYDRLDRWFFTGFFYRLTIVLAAVHFALQRRFRAALFVYFFAAALLVINTRTFRSAPFVMIALVAVAGIVTGEWWTPGPSKALAVFQSATRVLVACMALWLGARVITYTYQNRQVINYGAAFAAHEAEAKMIRDKLACGRPDVGLAYYPGNPYIHWFSDLTPLAGYPYMWPWVAEVALPDVIRALGHGSAIAYVQETTVWSRYRTADYLRPLYEYLNRNYVKAAFDNWYVSPDLVECAN